MYNISQAPTRLRPLFLLFVLILAAPSRAQYSGGSGSGVASDSYSAPAAMPLTLLDFSAQAAENKIVLQWTTAYESGTDYFLVERTVDGRSFATVGRVAAAGTSLQGGRLNYELLDLTSFTGVAHYRLKSVDLDGTHTYSDLVEVKRRAEDSTPRFVIHPNPSTGHTIGVDVQDLNGSEPVNVEILDAAGRRMFTRRVHVGSGEYFQLQLGERLPAGTYFLRMSQASFGSHTRRLLVSPFG
ncbi:T9SS type A sorting domain-containing protein [Lewinella sp. JB7]|uniref:T9SS type A sorting domain-containing protein n=1 Tax=Lewinella sp. JB7 TaxID=2962887 RepID=UPI0020C96AE8|nr:T9SS type A sorting domain-containing protein [Lewinella sp. JB7]MCP9234874.1 T9SS type A sorting domain-containing protein [Lewinella sp. JB7]